MECPSIVTALVLNSNVTFIRNTMHYSNLEYTLFQFKIEILFQNLISAKSD